jgi:hypothetical protein
MRENYLLDVIVVFGIRCIIFTDRTKYTRRYAGTCGSYSEVEGFEDIWDPQVDLK